MSVLDPFLDADVIALEDVAHVLANEDDRFDATASLPSLLELGTRLPSGLVHAESIWILAEPPPGLDPLAPESAWYAIDQSLAVVVPPLRAALAALLRDLAVYHTACARLARELSDRADLIEALLAPELPPHAATELALILDAAPQVIASIDRESDSLRAELAAMATRKFDPLVRLHAALRTKPLKKRGAQLAEDLLSRIPGGSFRLVISDGTLVAEHLSPYVRDLGHALTAWGLENAERLRTIGLAEALHEARLRPSIDLAALVVPDLFAHAPELRGERREAEAGAGLHLSDDHGMVHGFAELSRLSLADEYSIARESHGTLVIVAGAPESTLSEATRVFLESGRVAGIACVLSCAIDADGPVIPDAIATDADAARNAFAQDLAERTGRVGIEVHRPGCLLVEETCGAPRVAMDILALARRAKVLGRLDEDALTPIVLYPRASGARATLGRRIAELISGRLALYLLSSREDGSTGGRSRRSMSQNTSGLSRRFRA